MSPSTTVHRVDQCDAERLVREQFRIIETGEFALAETNVTAHYLNHRSGHEPLAARGRGPDASRPPRRGCGGRSPISSSRSTT